MEELDPITQKDMEQTANKFEIASELEKRRYLSDQRYEKLARQGGDPRLSEDEKLALEFEFSVYNAAYLQAKEAEDELRTELERFTINPSSSESD